MTPMMREPRRRGSERTLPVTSVDPLEPTEQDGKDAQSVLRLAQALRSQANSIDETLPFSDAVQAASAIVAGYQAGYLVELAITNTAANWALLYRP